MVEMQRRRIMQQLQAVQSQIASVELNVMTTDTVQGMQETRAALSFARVDAAPERVAELADATADLMEENEEVADAIVLQNPSSTTLPDLDQQLEDLQQMSLPSPYDPLPDIPTETPEQPPVSKKK